MRYAVGYAQYLPPAEAFVESVVRFAGLMGAERISVERIRVTQNPDFCHATNAIFHEALRAGVDRLLLLDVDLVFDPFDARRHLMSPLDFVAGDYARKEHGAGMASILLRPGEHGLVEAVRAGTGFLSLSRAALERMAAASPVYECEGVGPVAAIATAGPADGRWIDGGEGICRRWQSVGGVVWVDQTIRLGHVGAVTYWPEDA